MRNKGKTNLQASLRAVRFLTLRSRILCATTLSADAFAFTSSHCIVDIDCVECESEAECVVDVIWLWLNENSSGGGGEYCSSDDAVE